MPTTSPATDGNLALFACPNPQCDTFNRFDADNLSVCQHIGENKAIRRLYFNHCGQRFSQQRGSLMLYAKCSKRCP